MNLYRRIKELSPDYVVITCMEQLMLGLWLKLGTRIGVVYDCREDHPNAVRYYKKSIPPLLCWPASMKWTL